MSADARSILAPRDMNDTEPLAACKKSKTSAAAVTPAPITTLRVKRLTPDATLPRRGSERAAGYDLARHVLIARWRNALWPPPPLSHLLHDMQNNLHAAVQCCRAKPDSQCVTCSAHDCTIPAHGKGVVKTGLSLAIPAGTYARVAPRSGLAVKHFVDTGAGVVDEDYRGEVGVVLFNHGEADFQGECGALLLICIEIAAAAACWGRACKIFVGALQLLAGCAACRLLESLL